MLNDQIDYPYVHHLVFRKKTYNLQITTRYPGININRRRILVNLGNSAVLLKVLDSPHITKSVQVVDGKIDLCSRLPRLPLYLENEERSSM